MAKPLTEILKMLSGGSVDGEAGDKLSELVSAVDSTGKVGTLTIKISVKKTSKSAMSVLANIKMTKPQDAPDSTLMFPTPEGNLLLNDPRQQSLELKTVAKVGAVEPLQVGVR
jgi:hypothetical protein